MDIGGGKGKNQSHLLIRIFSLHWRVHSSCWLPCPPTL